MHECPTCEELFYHKADCEAHMTKRRHWIDCDSCSRVFASIMSCNQHMNALRHWDPQIGCHSCKRMFYTQDAANQHMKALGHFYDHFCMACDERFGSDASYRAHLKSQAHRETIIFCRHCEEDFISWSSFIRHLESGVCANACADSRYAFHARIQPLDPTGIITNGAAQGNKWVCCLCMKIFTIDGLISHVKWQAHGSDMYHCLNDRDGCGRFFGSLNALFHHLEKGSCGYSRFEEVEPILMKLFQAVEDGELISLGKLV
ncbi:unnamed protein product [Penicillium bialowiezense]